MGVQSCCAAVSPSYADEIAYTSAPVAADVASRPGRPARQRISGLPSV